MRTVAASLWDALRDFGAMAAIVLLCIGAAVCYGILHDQITARVCIEYFSVWHSTKILPPGMDPASPTQQGFFWGIFATWWMGMFIGVPLSIIARVGTAPPLSARDLLRSVATLLVVMAVCALVAGLYGFVVGGSPMRGIPPERLHRFHADLAAHNASYFVGGIGGIVVILHTAWRRWRRKPSTGS